MIKTHKHTHIKKTHIDWRAQKENKLSEKVINRKQTKEKKQQHSDSMTLTSPKNQLAQHTNLHIVRTNNQNQRIHFITPPFVLRKHSIHFINRFNIVFFFFLVFSPYFFPNSKNIKTNILRTASLHLVLCWLQLTTYIGLLSPIPWLFAFFRSIWLFNRADSSQDRVFLKMLLSQHTTFLPKGTTCTFFLNSKIACKM